MHAIFAGPWLLLLCHRFLLVKRLSSPAISGPYRSSPDCPVRGDPVPQFIYNPTFRSGKCSHIHSSVCALLFVCFVKFHFCVIVFHVTRSLLLTTVIGQSVGRTADGDGMDATLTSTRSATVSSKCNELRSACRLNMYVSMAGSMPCRAAGLCVPETC
jgi:hypothetical protein